MPQNLMLFIVEQCFIYGVVARLVPFITTQPSDFVANRGWRGSLCRGVQNKPTPGFHLDHVLLIMNKITNNCSNWQPPEAASGLLYRIDDISERRHTRQLPPAHWTPRRCYHTAGVGLSASQQPVRSVSMQTIHM